MNLYVLHEGAVTEKKVYRAWIRHRFGDHMREAEAASELDHDAFFLIAGGGYPSYGPFIDNAVREVRDNPNIDHLFVCVDSEEWTRERRAEDISSRLDAAAEKHGLRARNPDVVVHVIVQHCCIETWFLGNHRLSLRQPPTKRLTEYLAHYDVRADDPEVMPTLVKSDHRSPQAFHQAYLRELIQNADPPLSRYTKSRPDVVCTRDYFEALRTRTNDTTHLASLRHLFDTWDQIA